MQKQHIKFSNGFKTEINMKISLQKCIETKVGTIHY